MLNLFSGSDSPRPDIVTHPTVRANYNSAVPSSRTLTSAWSGWSSGRRTSEFNHAKGIIG
jgi:hypothetical protein